MAKFAFSLTFYTFLLLSFILLPNDYARPVIETNVRVHHQESIMKVLDGLYADAIKKDKPNHTGGGHAAINAFNT